MKRFLNSENIYLRAFTKKDLELLHNLNSDPEVMKYVKEPETIEDSKVMLNKILNSYDGNGLGVWAAIHIDTNEFMGFYILCEYENTGKVEIGYRLHKKFWGMGYATEMSKVLIDYGFDVLEIREIFALTMEGNSASEKVLKKCGLRKNGTTEKFYDTKLNYHKILN